MHDENHPSADNRGHCGPTAGRRGRAVAEPLEGRTLFSRAPFAPTASAALAGGDGSDGVVLRPPVQVLPPSAAVSASGSAGTRILSAISPGFQVQVVFPDG